MLKEWNKKTLFEKVISIVGVIISITIIILAFLQIFNVWRNSIYVYEPLLGILMLIQAVQNWKKNKTVAYISLFASIFILVVSLYMLIVKI